MNEDHYRGATTHLNFKICTCFALPPPVVALSMEYYVSADTGPSLIMSPRLSVTSPDSHYTACIPSLLRHRKKNISTPIVN